MHAKVHDGHSDRDAVGDLREDNGAVGVRKRRVKLHSPVNRAGVHDERALFEEVFAAQVQPENVGVFGDRREVRRALAFVLNAKKHHDIGVGDSLGKVAADAHA